MKRLFMVLAVMFLFVPVVSAQELSIGDALKKIPDLKQGIAYSLVDNDVSYLSTVQCFEKYGLCLEAGYSSKDKAVAVLSYGLVNLKEQGVTVPILDLIDARVGVYAGYGRLGFFEKNNDEPRDMVSDGNCEYDAGLSLTILNVKF